MLFVFQLVSQLEDIILRCCMVRYSWVYFYLLLLAIKYLIRIVLLHIELRNVEIRVDCCYFLFSLSLQLASFISLYLLLVIPQSLHLPLRWHNKFVFLRKTCDIFVLCRFIQIREHIDLLLYVLASVECRRVVILILVIRVECKKTVADLVVLRSQHSFDNICVHASAEVRPRSGLIQLDLFDSLLFLRAFV